MVNLCAVAVVIVCKLRREGDLVTIVDKMDLGRAVAEVYDAAERVSGGAHGPRLPHNLMPALRLTLQPVASQVCTFLCPSSSRNPVYLIQLCTFEDESTPTWIF